MPDRSVRTSGTRLRRDPVILAVFAISFLAGIWYLVGWGGEQARVVGFGLCQPVLNFVLAVLCRRVARLPGLPAPAARFWNALAIGATIFGVGDLVQVILDLSNPTLTSAITGTAHQVGLVVGAILPIAAMLTLPIGRGSGRDQLKFWLHASTVMVGAAVFAWYFSISPSVTSDGGDLTGSLLTVGVELVAAFAVVKLLLTGAAGFVKEAAIAGAAGAGLQGLADGITPAVMASPWLPFLVAAQMLPAAMVVCSPRIQELKIRADPELLIPAPRRHYSVLPYFAIAATLALLVVVLTTGGLETRVWGVLAGVVVSTSLVVVRQLAAFSENAKLLDQLDASFTELRRQEQLLRHQASHDHLTRLANRALFTERADLAAAGPGARTAVIMIDLDDFKPINDTLGHHVGDAVLVAVADRLRACVRPDDTVARLGGDEFAVLLPAVGDHEAAGVVQRITAALAEPLPAAGHVLPVRASIGLAIGVTADSEALLRDADDAMYAAKRRGAATRRRRVRGTVSEVVRARRARRPRRGGRGHGSWGPRLLWAATASMRPWPARRRFPRSGA